MSSSLSYDLTELNLSTYYQIVLSMLAFIFGQHVIHIRSVIKQCNVDKYEEFMLHSHTGMRKNTNKISMHIRKEFFRG